MLDRHELKKRAEVSLRQAPCDPKLLLLIHVGAMTLASLLLSVIFYLLQMQIDATGGLGGIGKRSILSTVQSVSQIFYLVLTPFWQAGYLTVAVAISRKEQADTDNLFSGLRRFGPLLRLYLLQVLIFGVIMVGSNNLSSFLYMLTPWGNRMMEQMLAILEQSGGMLPDDTAWEALTADSIPMLILGAVIFLAIAAPVFYRLRMSQYRIMDGQNSALRAIVESARMMKGRRVSLLKLDLSFWWFYALEVIIGLLAYVDILLELAGFPLPWSPAAKFFLPYILYLILQFGFQMWQKNRVAVTYAQAYEALSQPREAKSQAAPDPQKLPWKNSYDNSPN